MTTSDRAAAALPALAEEIATGVPTKLVEREAAMAAVNPVTATVTAAESE